MPKRTNTIRAIIKQPGKKAGHVSRIMNDLETLKKYVGGYIETVPVCNGCVMVINENGKIDDLPDNFIYGRTFPDMIKGTAVLVGTSGDEFTDCLLTMKLWKGLLRYWGNEV